MTCPVCRRESCTSRAHQQNAQGADMYPIITSRSLMDAKFGVQSPPRPTYKMFADADGRVSAVIAADGTRGVVPSGLFVGKSGRFTTAKAIVRARKAAHAFRHAGRSHPDGIAYNTADGIRAIDLRIRFTNAPQAADVPLGLDDDGGVDADLKRRLAALDPAGTARDAEAARIAELAKNLSVPETAAPSPRRITEVSGGSRSGSTSADGPVRIPAYVVET